MFSFYVLCLHVQMSPTKKSSKHARTDFDNFKFVEANLAYNDCYKRATIIVERVVKLDTLKDTCISKEFKERSWTKLRDHKRVFLKC